MCSKIWRYSHIRIKFAVSNRPSRMVKNISDEPQCLI